MYCRNSTYKNNPVEQCLYCNRNNSPCAYQRYCGEENMVIHTDTVLNCPYVLMEDGEKNG